MADIPTQSSAVTSAVLNAERDVLGELVAQLQLERIEENLFRGESQDLGWGSVFGGQALAAARQTAPEDRGVHSLHGYFLRRGDVKRPIVYEVDRIRDGSSFTTRRVVAIQHGHAIFNLSASFQIAEDGFEHAEPMPSAPPPEGLPSELELSRKVASHLPEGIRRQVTSPRPIEIRPVAPINPMRPDPRPARRQVWYRTRGALPDDLRLHQYLLAYASDFHFLGTAMQPHGVSWLSGGMQVASLDHAMWFHRPFRLDDWVLYDIESPSAGGARGLVTGRFYTRDGALVATTTQEGLMRRRRA